MINFITAYKEVGLYLSLNRSEEYLNEKNIADLCPKRKHRTGAKPKITGCGVIVDKTKRWKPWNEPIREPDDDEKRIMLKESLKIALETIMKNHTYKCQYVIRRQKEGGAIGIDLTGEMARIFMCWWDRQVLEKLSQLGITPFLYKRYVDDINMAVESLEKNYVYEEGRLKEIEGEHPNNTDLDQKMFEIIKAVGNEVHESIQLTSDTPSENEDGKVPILDLKCWIGESRNGKKHILHEHYMKSVSNKQVIHRQAAMSINSKRTILTQQCLRIILNCSEELEDETKNQHLGFFMARLQASGYDHEFRLEVLKSAKHAFQKLKERERTGGQIHRERTHNRTKRKKDKEEKKKNWFNTDKYESVLFVPATPNSELQQKMQESLKKTNVKIKVIERSGTKLVRMLQKNDPFKKKGCANSNSCLVCSGEKPAGCRDTGVTYKINCSGDCQFEYTGQTSQNAFTRGKKHIDDYNNKRENSALWKHCANVHGGEARNFKMTVLDRCRNDPTMRQILEAVRMQKIPIDRQMNSKSEWNTTKIPRIEIQSDVR